MLNHTCPHESEDLNIENLKIFPLTEHNTLKGENIHA